MYRKNLTKTRLEELSTKVLSERDHAILLSLQKCRYLLSEHIRRLHFLEHNNQAAATRATNKNLAILKEYGLIESLKQQVGGKRAGAKGMVRLLTEAGHSLLHLKDTGCMPRRRMYEPKLNLLEHTLAVAECYVQIAEFCREHRAKQIKTEFEPICWRNFTKPEEGSITLKPDLYSVIDSSEGEDSLFIEVDMNTESPLVVLGKCLRYAQYFKCGAEQRSCGVFPLVVWIVPQPSRKESILRHIAGCGELQPKNIFRVILPDEFRTLLKNGAEAHVGQEGDIAA